MYGGQVIIFCWMKQPEVLFKAFTCVDILGEIVVVTQYDKRIALVEFSERQFGAEDGVEDVERRKRHREREQEEHRHFQSRGDHLPILRLGPAEDSKAAHTTACRGVRTLVETMVAIEFAAS